MRLEEERKKEGNEKQVKKKKKEQQSLVWVYSESLVRFRESVHGL